MALAAVAAVPVLQSCSDDEQYDVVGNPNNLVYVDMRKSNVTETTLYRTPMGVYGESTANVPVCVLYAVEGSDIAVSANADTTLVSQYNAEHSTSYLSVPGDVLNSLVITPTQIDRGAKSASANLTVEIPASARTSLTGNDYVLPVRLGITGGKDDARKLVESKTNSAAYMVMHLSDDLAYVSGNTTATTSVVNTPVGVFGGIDGTFSVALHNAIDNDVKVSAEVDNSLVNTYNTDNGTSYKAMPSKVTDALSIESATVAAGETTGTLTVSGDKNLVADLADNSYVVPLRLTMTYNNGTVVKAEKSIAYVVVKIESTIIHANVAAADMPGTLMTDYAGVTASYTAGGTVDALSQLFDGDVTNGTALRTDEQDGKGTTMVFDLGQQRNVSGLRVARYYKSWYGGWWIDQYYFSQLDIEYSNDGSTWNEAGTVTESDMSKGEGYQYVAFYGAVPMRYMRIKFTSGSSAISSLAELGIYTK